MKNFECELCKLPYSLTVENGLKKYDLTSISKPVNEPFIILESVGKDHPSKLYCLIKMSFKKILRIGRSNISDVKLTDSSVSRNHALIKFQDQQFLLEDNQSKFGTVILIKNPIEIKKGSIMHFQAGRTMFTTFVYSQKRNNSCMKNQKKEMESPENVGNPQVDVI